MLKCKNCGITDKDVLVKHHASYKPEQVEILCWNCHAKLHKRIDARKRVVQTEPRYVIPFLNVTDVFEHIVRYYAKKIALEKDRIPILVDLTAGKRGMYENLEDFDCVDPVFIDVDRTVGPDIRSDSRFVPLKELCADMVVVDLPYPARLMSWSRGLYKTMPVRSYARLSKSLAKEVARILRQDGVLIWKCIDVFLKREQRLLPVHMNVAEWVRKGGKLRLWDIVVAVEPKATTRTFRRSVGLHTYFLIFRKLR